MSTPFDVLRKYVPLSPNRQLGENNILNDLKNWFQYHQQNIIENWWWYGGYHNYFLQRFPGEEERDYLARVQNATVENHVQPVIDIMVANLYSKTNPPKRYVTRDEEPDEELNDILERVVWNHNGEDLDDAKALTALVTGYAIIQREFLDIRTDLPFPLGASPIDKVKYGYIKKQCLDTTFAVPLPRIRENGMKEDSEVGAILFIADSDNFAGSIEVMGLMGNEFARQQVVEFVDDKYWLRWIKEDGTNEWKQQSVNTGSKFQNRNQFGRVTIPFSVYRNTGDPFSVEGETEVRGIKGLNAEINELSNGDRDVITYHQYPILMGLNGAKLPENFVRTKNSALELEKKDAKFEYLTWDGNLEESRLRQEALRQVVSQVKGVGLLSRGFMKEIGQIRSGPPLKALFTSDRSTMARKFKYFSKGEAQDMKADLLYYQAMTGADLGITPEVKFHCDFGDDFLGLDTLLNAEIQALKAQSGTEDIVTIMREVHPDWTDAEIESALKKSEKYLSSSRKGPSQSPDKKASQQQGS